LIGTVQTLFTDLRAGTGLNELFKTLMHGAQLDAEAAS
jgi:hypothetical protein